MTYVNPLVISLEEIREIANYVHWIPMVRGYHHAFIEERYPGWAWSQFLPILNKAGLTQIHAEGHACIRLRQGICIVPGVESVELTVKRGRTRVTRVEYEKTF